MSVAIVVDVHGLDPAIAAIEGLAHLPTEQLMTDVGAVLEASTRKRVEETKTSPDGAAWPPNRQGTSTLLETGRHLRDSIAYIASATETEVGASWEHAHVHQNGATITPKSAERLSFMAGNRRIFAKKVTIPPRPFVGFSAEDRRDVGRLVTDFLGRLVGHGGGR